MKFHTEEQLLSDLKTATSDLDLTAKEQRILEWLAGWDAETVGAVISMLHKARIAADHSGVDRWNH